MMRRRYAICGGWQSVSAPKSASYENVTPPDAAKDGAFRRAIATLSPQCRKVFILRKVHGLSHQEIADRMGLSVSTTSKHLAKALERCDAYMRALNEANAGGRDERAKKSNG